jgi:beta-glucosidase
MMFDHLMQLLIQWRMNAKHLSPREPVQAHEQPVCVVPLARDDRSGHAERARALTALMTVQEKLDYIGGVDSFCVRPLQRLGLPPIWMSDATSGVRGVDAPVTTFMAAVAMAASFNRQLVGAIATAIAQECRSVGVSVLLGPGVNLARVPTCGRNFEYMGEDPYLAGEMASAYAVAAQQAGVIPTIKHYACNNSEYDRHKTDSVVDERTLRELYLKAFSRVISHGVLGLMTSYNLINGTYASENRHLLEDILRGEWGFDGMVVSDWNSLYSSTEVVKCGVDIEMPCARWMSPKRLKPLLDSKEISIEDIDRKIIHILDTWSRVGVLDRPVNDSSAPIGTASHKNLALQAACEGAVLLKNDGSCLPLDPGKVKHVVVLGRNARELPSGGGGSSYILKNLPNEGLESALKRLLPPSCTIETLGRSWQCSPAARSKVRQADAVVVCTGYDHVYETEAYDRMWDLPWGQSSCIRSASRLNTRTIVILSAGGAMETESWIGFPAAVVHSMYLGECSAQALALLLTGAVNFSGKLPFTIAKHLADYESIKNYPADYSSVSIARIRDGQGDPQVRHIRQERYEEGLLVGYRQFDTQAKEVRFPFGHGLSYTRFTYSDLELELSGDQGRTVHIRCTVRNDGPLSGAEVVQLYVHAVQPKVFRVEQELKGFEKLMLQPGQEAKVGFSLFERDLAYYDVGSSTWKTDAGQYVVRVGSSSRDIRLSVGFDWS